MTAEGTSVFEVRWGAASDPGGQRRENEDAYLATPPVFMVADGMGGHERGGVASRTVVAAFAELSGTARLTSQQLYRTVKAAAREVRAAGGGLAGGPGSTLAGVGLADQDGIPCWLVFNIGDSRVYRLAGGQIEQVSVDHSRVQELVDAGVIDVAQARSHPSQNVITRAIGAGATTEAVADLWLLLAVSGDRMLVCSDGLTRELSDTLVRATLLTESEPQAAADALVAAAVSAGARDNVTVVVVDAVAVSSPGAPPGSEPAVTSNAPWSEVDDDTLPGIAMWQFDDAVEEAGHE